MPFANTSKKENTVLISLDMQVHSVLRARCWKSMFIGNPVGNTDRLLDFSTAVTGTLFFAPSYDLLGED